MICSRDSNRTGASDDEKVVPSNANILQVDGRVLFFVLTAREAIAARFALVRTGQERRLDIRLLLQVVGRANRVYLDGRQVL